MKILVTFASKRGATRGIAERIAETLTREGLEVDTEPVEQAVGLADGLADYDAFVIGSAAYVGHWLKEATEFVRSNQTLLASRPVWLFSSGPIGTQMTDAKGRDVITAAAPLEFAELGEAIKARGLQVFFGALDPKTLGLPEKAMRLLPAGRALLAEGDFRNWPEIESWARDIARDLTAVPVG